MLTLSQSISFAKVVSIDVDELRVRTGPSTAHELIGHVNQGEQYTFLDETDEWIAINYNGGTGWVSRDYVTINDDQTVTIPSNSDTTSDDTNNQNNISSTSDFKIPVDKLHLREAATTESEILSILTKGDSVVVIEQSNDWVKVNFQDTEGYIPSWILNEQIKINLNQTPLRNKVIVIDPGHGGYDVGAISVHNNYEKNFALNTAKHLQDQLELLGAKVHLTRSDDYYYALTPRAILANYHGADVFLSIHYNSEPQYPSANGINTYYRKSADLALAEFVHQGILETTKANDRGVLTGDYLVLRNSKRPSLLLELGFLSNESEEMLIQSPGYQDDISRGIIIGLENYFYN